MAGIGDVVICPECGVAITVGSWPFCPHSEVGVARDAQIHTSEKVTVWENPSTGEVRIPGRADRPIHQKYQDAGFTRRKTIDTHSQLRDLEKKTGTMHEMREYNRNSVLAEKDTGSR